MATLSLHSLFELRSCILNGTVMLDMRANSIEEIAGKFCRILQISDLPFSCLGKVIYIVIKKNQCSYLCITQTW